MNHINRSPYDYKENGSISCIWEKVVNHNFIPLTSKQHTYKSKAKMHMEDVQNDGPAIGRRFYWLLGISGGGSGLVIEAEPSNRTYLRSKPAK